MNTNWFKRGLAGILSAAMILTSSPVITLADEVGNVPAEPAVVSVETPDSTPESIPEAAPEVTPDSTPEVDPGSTPESTPDSSVPESAESGSESDGSDQDADSESTKEDAESTPESTPEDAQAVQEELNAATQAEKDKILAEVVNITVMKYWNDNNADHGGNLTLTLQRNDGQTYPIVLNAGGGWLDTHSYPKYQSVPENPDGTLGTPVPYSYTLLETESYDGGDTDMSKYFTIVEPTKTDADGTLQMELRNVRETEYKSTKIWRDNENKYGTRPSVSSYINGNISIMQRIGDNTPTAVDLKGKGMDYYVDIQAADDITWNIAFKNLPAYAEDNTPIEYILVESEQIPAAAGHTGYEGSYYEPLYRNEVNFASIEDGLYNKGVLTNTLVKDDGFTFNKVWLDDGTEQRPKGSFILYRYVDGKENYQSSSPIQGMDTSLKQVDATYTFGFEDEVGVLPQYDPEGRMYVYYVKEICNDSRYEKVVDGNLNGDKADKNEKFLVANNGTIYNRRHGTTSVSGSKTFVAGAIQGDKFDVTVQLQKQVTDEEGNISWVNVEGQAKNVGGFTSETMTKSFDFSVPQFDEKGLPLTYRVIETGMGITDEDGKYGTATKESGYVDGDVAEVGAGILNDQDPHGFQFRTEVSNGKLTNVLIGQTDVQIKKVWAGGVEPVYPVTGVVVGSDGSEKPFIITENDGDATHVVMPRYDERGGEITYNVRESVNGPYVPTYAYEDGSCIDDTGSPADANTPDGIHEILRAATITNGPIGEGTWITVQKEWIDDGDAAHRGDVKVAAFDPDGKIHTYTINGQTVESNTVILNDNNGWLDYIYVSPESNFDCSNIIVREVAVGDSVTLYSDDEVANAINGIDAKGLYDAEFAGRVNAGFNAYGATITGNHVYVSTVDRTGDANNIATVINRRVGNVVFDFNKTWDDGNNQQGDRPDSLVIEIRRDGSVVGTCTLTEENGWQATTWDDNGEKVFLPKYDESGALYEYTVKETAKDKGQPYDMAAHEYACSSSNKYTVGNAYNAHTSDLYEYKFHNQKSKTVTPIFYKLWLDDLGNMYGQRRPDIFVTLYRSLKGEDGQWSQPAVVREYVDRDWSTQYSPYDWAVTFESLPKYNDEGYEYAYYVRETKSQASSKYEDTYYTGNMVGHWTTSGTPTLNLGCLQGQTTDDQATGNFAGFIPINGTIVNTRFDEVEIEGRKVWTGLSDHWTVMSRRELLDACPEVTISLWREDTDGVRRPVTEADRRGGDISDAEGDLSDVLNAVLSGTAPVTAVVDGYNSEYNMGIFDRYDRDGQFVKYFVIEEDKDGKLQKVWDGVYDINLASANNFRLTNVYNGNTGHKVEFDKKFLNIDDQIALGKKMPDVEFILQSYMPVVNAAGEKEYEVEFQTFSSKAGSQYYYSDVVIDPDPSTDPKTTWTVTFPGLRKYAPNLQELRYALKEVKINGYTVGQVGEDGTMPDSHIIMDADNGVTTVLDGNTGEIINEYNKLLRAEVTKDWDFRGALVPDSEKDNYKEPVYLTLMRRSTGDSVVELLDKDGKPYANTDANKAIVRQEVSSATNWKANWEKLAQYAPDGTAYTYKVFETNKDGQPTAIWTMSGEVTLTKNDTTLTGNVKNQVNFIRLRPRKTWSLDGKQTATNSDIALLFSLGAIPEKVTFELHRVDKDGNDVIMDTTGKPWQEGATKLTQQVTVKSAVTNYGSYVTVPATDAAGNAYTYYFKEQPLSGYSNITPSEPGVVSTVNGNGTDSLTTNTIPVKPLTITKNWFDDWNRDGLRPSKLSFTVIRDGNQTATVTINAPTTNVNTWSTTVYVPVYQNDNQTYSQYTVSEATITEYSKKSETQPAASVDKTTGLTYTVDNEHITNDKVDAEATKVWTSNYDGYTALNTTKPQQTFTLKATATGATEAQVKAYVNQVHFGTGVTPTQDQLDAFWTHTGNFDPQNGGAKTTWSELPAYYQNTVVATPRKITYTVVETKINGWTASATNASVSSATSTDPLAITVTNTREGQPLKVTKTWADQNNKYNTRPNGLTFNVQYATKAVNGDWSAWTNLINNGAQVTMTIAKNANPQEATLSNLPKYSSDGLLQYRYQAVEVTNATDTTAKLGSYSAAGPGTTDNNSAWTNTPVVTTLSVVKNMPQDKIFVDVILPHITAVKYRVERRVGSGNWSTVQVKSGNNYADLVLTANKTANFAASVTDLPEKDADGNAYEYRAVEISYVTDQGEKQLNNGVFVDDNGVVYGTTASGTTTITNEIDDKVDVDANKVWVDTGIRISRPVSVQFDLYANNVKMDAATYTKTVTSTDNWSVTWEDLPAKDAYGTAITYSVRETIIDGYATPVVEGDMTDGYTITNTATSFHLIKKDAISGQDLAGAQFTIEPKSGSKFSDGTTDPVTLFNGTTDVDETVIGLLVVGNTYIVKETQVPTGYTAVADQEFTVPSNGVVELTINDPRQPAQITIKKVDKDGNNAPLKNAVYGLFESADADPTTATPAYRFPATNASGEASLSFANDGLVWGTYYLMEITPPVGYNRNTTIKEVVIDANNLDVTIDGATESVLQDSRIKGKMILVKSDSAQTDTRLNGVQFKLEKLDESTPTGSWIQVFENFFTGKKYSLITEAGTDADGTLTIEDLEWGTYKITEIKPKNGWVIGAPGSVSETFTIDSDTETARLEYTFSNITNTQVSINILKTGENGTALDGVALQLAGDFVNLDTGVTAAGTVTWDSTSSARNFNNVVVSTSSETHTYTLTETARKSGYEAFTGSVTFTVDTDGKIHLVSNPTLSDGAAAASVSGDNLTLTLRNIKIGGNAKIRKLSSATGNAPIQGVVFELYQKVGDSIDAENDVLLDGNLVTDGDGYATTGNLEEGNYYFKEKSTLDNYVFDATPQEFSIGANDNDQTIEVGPMYNTPLVYTVSVKKIDSHTGADLSGAQFTLYKQVAGGAWETYGQPKTTGADGMVSFTINHKGTYKVAETMAPANFVVATWVSDTFTIDNTSDYQNGTKSFGPVDNVRKTGSATVQKVDALTGEALEGVEFTLTNNHGCVAPVTAVTNANGVATFEGLTFMDSYTITETGTLDTYILSSRSETFTLTDAQVNVSFTGWQNSPTEFSFKKIQATPNPETGENDPLPGATFAIYATDASGAKTGDALDTQPSDENGIVTFRYLKKGATYRVEETEAPTDYFLNLTSFTVIVSEDGKTITMSDADGTVTEVPNDEMGDITLNKVDEKDQVTPLAGAIFDLYATDEAGEKTEVIDTQTTDENGVLTFSKLHLGTYVIVENEPAEGYMITDTETKVTLEKGTATQHITVKRTNGKPDFDFSKNVLYLEGCYAPEATQMLGGVQFGLFEDAACATRPEYLAVSDESGNVKFEYVTVQTWYMKETAVPVNDAGVVLDETIYEVVVNKDGTTTIDAVSAPEVIITNDVARTKIVLKKTEEGKTNVFLPGAKFGLYRTLSDEELAARLADEEVKGITSSENEVLVAEAVTDKDGVVTFEDVLTSVDYIIRELEAPAGYELTKESAQIEFAYDAESGAIAVKSFKDGNGVAKMDDEGNVIWNDPPTKIAIIKKDEAGNALEGATLRILNEDGTRVEGVEDWVSGKEAHRVDGLLVRGKTYILQEVSAPNGYYLADPVKFTLTTDKIGVNADYVQTVTMVDKKIPPKKTPKTGDNGMAGLWVALLAVSGGAAGIVFRRKKKQAK